MACPYFWDPTVSRLLKVWKPCIFSLNICSSSRKLASFHSFPHYNKSWLWRSTGREIFVHLFTENVIWLSQNQDTNLQHKYTSHQFSSSSTLTQFFPFIFLMFIPFNLHVEHSAAESDISLYRYSEMSIIIQLSHTNLFSQEYAYKLAILFFSFTPDS